MKNHILFVLFSVILIVSLAVGSGQQSASATERLLPRISFEKTVFDLGEIGQGTKNTCDFRFTNTGRGLLKIGNISRTCGCTVFKLDKNEYAPNETGAIKVIYTAGKSTENTLAEFFLSTWPDRGGSVIRSKFPLIFIS